MRANPFSAIFAHCQLTRTRNGAFMLEVVHTRLTSRPGASAVSGLHSQTRPSSSVTRRNDIVGVSKGWNRKTAIQEMECARRVEVTADSMSCEKRRRTPVSLITVRP